METIPLTFKSDEKGYFDRQCPNENCLFEFKVYMQDWKEKFSDEEVYCPLCGCVAPSNEWFTEEQTEQIHNVVADWTRVYIENSMSKLFKKLEQTTKNNRYLKIKYKSNCPTTFINNPIGAKEEWELDITCEKCGARFSVIGSAFFCPCCGYNSASKMFDESLDSVSKMLQSIDEFHEVLEANYGKDKAETMSREMIENTICQIVSTFQKFAQCRVKEICGKEYRVNDFQIVDKGDTIFKNETNHSYSDWLSQDEISYMRLFFQKRHIVEHNSGIIDQKYIDNSNDNSYTVGQRLIVKKDEVIEFLRIVKKLGAGIKILL
ncbi:MAG: hypothetical protein IK990_13720 [Ruminiclostridium sp.]|nr:hypothetical protein [Ruminiclostridium sp.]